MSIPRRPIVWIAVLAFAATVGVWAFLYFGGDSIPLATLLLFGPRWIAALPLLILVPLAGYARSYWVAALTLLAGLIVAGPITGGSVAVDRWFGTERPALMRVRVVSWNMGGKKAGPEFKRFLEPGVPTILFVQESGLTADAMPSGWKLIGEGGNRIATQLPVRFDARREFGRVGGSGRLDRYVLETPDGEFVLVNLHLPTPRPGIEVAIASKGRDLSELRRMIEVRREASQVARDWVGERSDSTIVAGDFNMPVESRIYRDHWASFRNAFNEAGMGWGTTKQTRWHGVRIDHILYTSSWRCLKAWVGPSMGSDHRPMIAELALEGS
jgi:exonuclease III